MTIRISLSHKRFSFPLEKALDYINYRIDEKINLDDLDITLFSIGEDEQK